MAVPTDLLVTERLPLVWAEVDDGGMALPEVIPDWVLLTPPLPEEPCACCSEPADVWGAEPGWSVPGVTWGESPQVRRPRPSPEVEVLLSMVERVSATDPAGLSPEQALVDAEVLLRVGQLLRVHEVRLLADAQHRDLFILAGQRSATSWLRDMAPDADASVVTLAKRLSGFEVLVASVQAGHCALSSARKVVRALLRCRPHLDQPNGLIDTQPAEVLLPAVIGQVPPLIAGCLLGVDPDDVLFKDLLAATARIIGSGGSELDRLEAAFTLLAEHVPPALLSGCLEDLVLAVLPSMLQDRDQHGRDRAGLSLHPARDSSGWHLEADLDLECGERLFTALAAEARRDQHNPLDTAAAAELRAHGLDPHDPNPGPVGAEGTAAASAGAVTVWPRSKRARLHDAFNHLLGRYLHSGLGGSTQKMPVQIHVTVPSTQITGEPGALPARADSGTRIPRTLLRRWWCDSRITTFVLNQTGTALRVVHTGRTLTATERRAALVEQRGHCAGSGCCHPGPDPTRDLRPHHVQRWTDQHHTSLNDTLMICDTLHRDLHEGHKTIRLRDGRHLNEHGWTTPPRH